MQNRNRANTATAKNFAKKREPRYAVEARPSVKLVRKIFALKPRAEYPCWRKFMTNGARAATPYARPSTSAIDGRGRPYAKAEASFNDTGELSRERAMGKIAWLPPLRLA